MEPARGAGRLQRLSARTTTKETQTKMNVITKRRYRKPRLRRLGLLRRLTRYTF
jgi:hypothetical protein